MTSYQIGRYEIKYELGRGGMATVFRAHDPVFKRDVALKILPREFLHDPTFRARFDREAQTVANLEHEAIVPVYDVGEEQGQPYLVMRYLNGGTLGQRMKQGPMSPTEIVKILNRLASALDNAHSKGIIHRDLKPDNILFDQRNEAFLTDFGIAKLTDGNHTLTSGGIVIGTPAYLSPEQANGEKLDARSDIYSIGVILFEMLTGQLPYRADTPIGLIMKHMTEPIPYLLEVNPNLPPDCNIVIRKVLAKERDERYDSTTALATAFAEAIDPNFTPWPDMERIFDTNSKLEKPAVAAPPPAPAKQAASGVICPKCQVSNPFQTRFCLNCGQRLKIDCARCHTENRIDSPTCTNCGAHLKIQQTRRRGVDEARQRAVQERSQSFKEKEAQKVREKIQSLLNDLTRRKKRTEALGHLNRLDKKTLDILRENLRSARDSEARYLTAKVLGQLSDRADINVKIKEYVVEILIDAIDDEEPKVRLQAQEALQTIGNKRNRDVSEIFSGILGWLKDDD